MQAIKLYPLAYSAALLPLATIHLCYFIAAGYGHVEWCIPYFDSCSSISAAGREPPEFFLFKGLMIPAAVLLCFYWLCCERWLAAMDTGVDRYYGLVTIAVIASLGLILYSVMLGAIGDLYQMQRRIGVTTFFGLSYIAQLLVNRRLSQYTGLTPTQHRLTRWLTRLSVIVLLAGLASVAMQVIDDDYYDTKEDAFEWSVTLLLCLHVFVVGRLWQLTGFSMQFNATDKSH